MNESDANTSPKQATKQVPKQGRIEEISSPSNPRIKSIKALAMKKNRDREKLFLVEGLKLVVDALETGWNIRMLLHAKHLLENENLSKRVVELANKTRARGGDVLITNGRDNPQTVVAVLEQKLTPLKQVVPNGDNKSNECWLALDRVRDPGNLGTILRTADALGAKGVVLVGETTDPFALEAVRATMGSLFHIKLARATVPEFLLLAKLWQAANGQVIGTHLKGAVDHRSIDYSNGPQLILMGNEQQGLTDELAGACNRLALIAMNGAADSLNLAVATGIMLFEARRHALQGINKEKPA